MPFGSVYDGHGGQLCSAFVKKKLHVYIREAMDVEALEKAGASHSNLAAISNIPWILKFSSHEFHMDFGFFSAFTSFPTTPPFPFPSVVFFGR
jgi:serine/threonine protein phosphatase PrpC